MGSPLAPAILITLTRELRRKTVELAKAYKGTATWYADNLVVEVPGATAGRAKRALAKLLAHQRWEVKSPPNEHPTVLGWNWVGLQAPTGPETRKDAPRRHGWRLSRRRRRRAAARAEDARKRATAHSDPRRAKALLQRAESLTAYAQGPASRKTHAPTYAKTPAVVSYPRLGSTAPLAAR